MPIATEQTRPAAHACCPNARVHLRTYSFCGSWSWKLTGDIPAVFCPWCAIELPKKRSTKLEVVKTND